MRQRTAALAKEAVVAVQEDTLKTRIPYIPHRTFRNFLERIDVIPQRIDRSILRYTSGATQTLLMHTFRALDLVGADDRTESEMFSLAIGFKEGDKEPLRKMVRDTYPSLMG